MVCPIFCASEMLGLECPAPFVPVAVRETGMKGAWNGTRQEADAGADCRIVAADRGGYGDREGGSNSMQ